MLYGRDAERSRIADLLEDARAGQSGVLVLRGEPGVGKSRLLEDARGRADGMTVLSGGGIESEAHAPYAGLHQILRPVLGKLERLPAPQARALGAALGLEDGVADEWFLVSLAVLSLLAEAAEEQPLLCLVDDAHWLDDASAESLVFAARRLDAEPIAMIFAAREGEIRTFDAPGLEELRLSGLDPEAAAELVAQHVDGPLSPAALAQLIDSTDGNPLGLLEFSSTLGGAQPGGVEPLLDPLPVGDRIKHAFLSRVERLPPETQALLLVLAAEDTGSLATVARAAARLGAEIGALDAAEEARLVQVEGAKLVFRHPLIRSAVYQAAPWSRRRAAHQAIAEVLDPDSEGDLRAWHRAAASVAPDPAVAAELEQAGRRAQRRSGFVAASLAFERAAALTEDQRDRARLLGAAVEGAWFAGRLERALMLLERARPITAEPAALAEITFWRGLIELNAGVPADAAQLLMGAAAKMGAANPGRALYVLSLACVASAYAGNGALVPAIAERAADLQADGPLGRFLAEFVSGTGSWFAGDFKRAAPRLRTALDLADEAQAAAPPSQFRGLLLLAGGAGLFLGDDRAAERLNRLLAVEARESGSLPLLTQALPRLAMAEIGAAHWSSAAASLEEGVRLARQAGQHQVVAHMLSVLALIAGLRGDDERCHALATKSGELASARNLVHVAMTARWARLAVELAHGRLDEALLCAQEISELPISLWSAPDRIEAAIRGGDEEAADAWLAAFESWAESGGEAWAKAVSLRCRALLSHDDTEAEDIFRLALDVHRDDAGRPFERARTEFAFGEFLRRTRRRVEAREHLHVAVEGFEELGALPWAERARSELRASGQTARKRDPSTRAELTPQEVQIAGLVARGLSNREVAAQLFLSPRTIDFHLRNIYRKLEITSRTQLAQLELDPAIDRPAQSESRAALRA